MSVSWAALWVGATLLASPERLERTVYLMGTEARIQVEAGSRAAAIAASERAIRALMAAENRLSTWRSDTELARLNRLAPGERLRLSEDLAGELREAAACWRETGGAFDPTVGNLVRAWELRQGGRWPSAEELAIALEQTGMDGLRWHGPAVVERRAGVLLEEGGFGKGAGLVDALEELRSSPGVTSAVIDFGGQVATGGNASWTLVLADPRDRDRAVLELSIAGGSLATSGNSERGLRVDGRRVGHILDPRTGYPAEDFGSLTVWAPDPLWADCLATGLYAAGPEAALAWAAGRPDVEVLVLQEDGDRIRARMTAGLQGRLRPLVADLVAEIDVSGDSSRLSSSSHRSAPGSLLSSSGPDKERGWRNPWQVERDSSTPQ